MSDELFAPETVAMDSPRIAWMKKHGFETEFFQNGGEESIPLWVCRVAKQPARCRLWTDNQIAEGDTEDEACANLADKRGLKLWNEL